MNNSKILAIFFLLWGIIFIPVNMVAATNHEVADQGQEEVQIEDEEAFYKELASQYKGAHDIITNTGITIKPDEMEVQGAFILMMFKGDAPKGDEYEFEMGAEIPLSKVKTIDGDPVDQSEANRMLADIYLFQDGEAGKAVVYYQKALDVDAKNKIALENMGSAYNYLEKYEDAINLGLKAQEAFPENQIICLNIGIAYAAINKNDLAIEHFNKVVSLNPNFGEAYLNLGMLYQKINDKPKARENLLKAKSIFEKAPDVNIVASIDGYLKEMEE